jgi:hypothetical protein
MVRKGKLYGRASLTAILRPLGGLLTGGHQNARAEGYDETKKVLVGATSPIADEECAVLLGRIPRSGSGVADAALASRSIP